MWRRGWWWRRGWGRGPGRPPKPRFLEIRPRQLIFIPFSGGEPVRGLEPVYLTPEEAEALRLVYFLGLTQEEAARRMGISRGSLWRSLDSARRKIAQAISEGRAIIIMA